MQILGRWLKRRRRPQGVPSGPFGIGRDPGRERGVITWPELIRTVQAMYGLSTVDLGKLMGKSTSTIRTYRSSKVKRDPPESFKRAIYKLLRCLETAPAEVLLTLDGRTGLFKGTDEKWHAVALGTGVFLHRCLACNQYFVSQWNAKRCPTCREKTRTEVVDTGEI